jgi:hypothetical protein
MKQDIILAGQQLLDKQNSENNVWAGKTFESYHYLSADYSGKAGEIALYNFLIRTKKMGLHTWFIEYDGDSNVNPIDGTYDMSIIGNLRKRLGVKTARLGKQGSFQHDHLHDGECDGELLIDITPIAVYLTIICFNTYSLKDKHPVFELTPHLRKNTNNNYKLDLRERHLDKGVKSKITLRLDDETTDIEVINFLRDFID